MNINSTIHYCLLQAYLKEFLHKMCVYNVKAPHKNMWELKPEYRHYENADTPATSDD